MSLVQKYLAKIPQYTRMGRHMRAVLGHGNLRKWANLARVELERKLRRIQVKGRPYILFLDPCNYCNLRCPLCPTGMKELGRDQSMLPFTEFKRYIDPLLPYLFEVNLHNWGESMINKDVFAMIEYAQRHNVGTNMSSNLVIAGSDDLDGLLDAGLEYLSVSLDGADQASYEKYRVRGDFQRVVDNIAELIRRRAARKQKTPFIEWQYIVMKHNEHKVPEAERLAKQLGVDLLRFIPVGLPYEARNREALAQEWFPQGVKGYKESSDTQQIFGQSERPSPCYYLYRSMVINPDGGVSPCCIVYQQRRDFAKLADHGPIDPAAVYNNPMYQSARSLYSPKVVSGRVRTVCDGCDLFARHPSKHVSRSQLGEIRVDLESAKGKSDS